MFVNKMLAFFRSLITCLLLAHFSHSLAQTESLTQANIFLSIKFLNFFDCKKYKKWNMVCLAEEGQQHGERFALVVACTL